MNPVRPLLLAGLASVAVAGIAGLAHAGDAGFKTLTVQLPGGGIEQIEYTGPVAPQVVLEPASAADPVAALEHMSAEMDQQAAAMINAVNAMAAGAMPDPGSLEPVALGGLPPAGAVQSFIASLSGGSSGACMQSVEITAMGDGQPPRVVSQRSGNCGGMPDLSAPGGAVPAALPAAPVPLQQPQLIRVKYLVPKTPVRPSQS
jgi:hypothetical protein